MTTAHTSTQGVVIQLCLGLAHLEVLHEAVFGVQCFQEVLAGLLVGGVHHCRQLRTRH